MSEGKTSKRLDDALLENWQNRFQLTKNPMCVWEAIRICSGQIFGEPRPLPIWCLEYLAITAERLSVLQSRKDYRNDKQITWSEAIGAVSSALDLSGKGWNAFKSATSDEEKWKAAVQHDWTMTQVEGLEKREAKEKLAATLGIADQENLKKVLQKGRKLGPMPRREEPNA